MTPFRRGCTFNGLDPEQTGLAATRLALRKCSVRMLAETPTIMAGIFIVLSQSFQVNLGVVLW
jgi:hypothetical protein